MCFDHDALPPELPADLVLPHVGGGAAAEAVELTSADGTRFSAALALSSQPQDPAVVILPDVRGLYRFYVELAERFAAAGHHAVAIDYFGRTAGLADAGERENDWDYWDHVRASSPAQIQADIAAAIDLLRERGAAGAFVTVGFCFGGAQSFLAATNPDLPLDAAVGFYGALSGERLGIPAPKDEAVGTRHPVLAMFGGADEGIPAADRQTFEENLERSGAPHEVVVYPGAPHSFFDRKQEQFAEDSEDAWRRTLGFLSQLGATARG
jgi:carboxymethylenebutenolidase